MDEETSRAKGEPIGPTVIGERGEGERATNGAQSERPTKHLDNLLAALRSVGAGGGTGTISAISSGSTGCVITAVLGGDDAAIGGRGCAIKVQVSARTHVEVTGGVDVHRIPSGRVFGRWMVCVFGRGERRGGHARQR